MTCGAGTRIRTRLCDNPTPIHGGATCPGDGTETEDCQDALCPGECYITHWNVTPVHRHALNSVITRPRYMVEPPVLGMVRKLRTVRMLCAQVSAISHSCMDSCSMMWGPGTRTRTRLCDNPTPIHGGATCPGDGEETEDCQDAMCPGKSDITLWHGFHVP